MTLRYTLALVLAGLLTATAAFADDGIILRVGDCSAGSTVQSIVNDCSSNAGNALDLVVSCVVPMPFDNFVAAMSVIDVQTASATLPDWWRMDAGGCRAGAFTVEGDAAVSPSCPTIWDSFSGMISAGYEQIGVLGSNNGRFVVATAIPAPGTLPGDGTTEYGVARIRIQRVHSTGAGACAGCDVHAMLTLREVQFQNDTGIGNMRFFNPAIDVTSLSVTYEGQYPVPTRNRTWGAIKSLYR